MSWVAVLARERGIEAKEGRLDSGGDGKLVSGDCSMDTLALGKQGVAAIDGDWRGDCIGLSDFFKSVMIGGRRGVVA